MKNISIVAQLLALLLRLCAMLTPVTVSSAPASWPPAADCFSSLPLLGQQQKELQRHPAAPQAPGVCQARVPATSQAQWGQSIGQGPRHGLWTRTSAPAEQLLLHQFPPHLLCRIPPLRTHNHQVKFLHTCVYTLLKSLRNLIQYVNIRFACVFISS